MKGIFTRDSALFDRAIVGQTFPLKRSSELRTGILEEMGRYLSHREYSHTVELSVPKNLTERRMVGFLLDADNIVVAKARGIVADIHEFHLSDSIESRVSVERASRTQGIYRLSKLDQQRRLQSVETDLAEAIKEHARLRRNRPEYLEATDGVKLAYRAYFPVEVELCRSLFVILATNSHFHDNLASQLSGTYPIASFILELRGYGHSGGVRGFSPSKEQIWIDIRTFVRHLKMNYPNLHIFLGGHQLQSGLVLNYSAWREREPVDGYLFLSPQFNLTSGTIDGDSRKSSDSFNSSSTTSIDFKRYLEQQTLHSDMERELNPLLVEMFSVNILKACNSLVPRKLFDAIDRPFGMWAGDKEDMLTAESLSNEIGPTKHGAVRIVPQQTTMGVFNRSASLIGDWIINLDSGQKDYVGTTLDLIDVNNFNSIDYQHTLLRDVDLIVNNFVKLGLDKTREQFLLGTDGAHVKYRVFMPVKKPIANVVLLQSDIKVVLAWILSKKCEVAVYVMDLRGIDNGAVCLTKESIWADVKILVRYLKINEPEMPLLLGGHGYGASVALNYSCE